MGRPDREEILTGVAEILEGVAGVDPATVVETARFDQDGLDVDSLSLIEVAVSLEQMFGIRVPHGDEGKWRTVGDLVSYVSDALGR